MIIKIKEDEINNYLEIEENIYENYSENFYKNESIYILHYPNSDKVSVSFGYGIEKINDYDIKHKCNTLPGSSGGPIFNLQTNKIIGIHKGFIKKGDNGFNIGTFLKFPLDKINKCNEIKMKTKNVFQLEISGKDFNELQSSNI